MLSSETKVVTYVNKKGERSTYPLNSAMESANLEMVKRLKYTKDILTHMLNANVANINRPATNGGDINQKDPTGMSAPYDQTNPTGPTASQTGRP
jgi:polo-like kinase 1